MPHSPISDLQQNSDIIFSFGKISLDTERRILRGPRGEIRLENMPYRLFERLIRRPGVIIQTSDLVTALWPEPDDEPENPEATIKYFITVLRNTLISLGGNGRNKIGILNERGVGYFLAKLYNTNEEKHDTRI